MQKYGIVHNTSLKPSYNEKLIKNTAKNGKTIVDVIRKNL
jgi:hypothetical protein